MTEIDELRETVTAQENDFASTGSMMTTEQVQGELDAITSELYAVTILSNCRILINLLVPAGQLKGRGLRFS